MTLVDTNCMIIEYPARSQPDTKPKIHNKIQLYTKTYVQILLPVLFETYNAIKSVPPVLAFPTNAATIPKPYTAPPITMFNMISSNKISNLNTVKNIDTHANCNDDSIVNFVEIDLPQSIATGRFSNTIISATGICI